MIATEFGAGAECAAAKIVDYEPPADSGGAEAGSLLQSVVQICARPADGLSLDEFMAATYGGTVGFEQTEIGGLKAYAQGNDFELIAFTQTEMYRFEVLTNVTAERTVDALRVTEVKGILATVRFD